MPLPAAEIGEWVLRTGRRDNGWILAMLRSAPFGDSLEAVQALGRREDPYVADILDGLLADRSGRRAAEIEQLLRLLLEGMVPPPGEAPSGGASTGPGAARVRANRDWIGRLAGALLSFRDSGLRAALLRLLYIDAAARPSSAGRSDWGETLPVDVPGIASLLMAEGRFLADRLPAAAAGTPAAGGAGREARGGHLDGEIDAFLDLAGRCGAAELSEMCISLAERSANPRLVGKARRVAADLLRKAY